MQQLALDLPLRGGKRKGAGRKPKGRVALVSHAARPELDGRTPVHAVWRVLEGVPNLRSRKVFEAVLAAFAAGAQRGTFRLTHYCVLGNHLHLIVEAGDEVELSRGLQSLAIRIARAVNRATGRSGRVFADHYFAHQLQTPREVRHAIRYVLRNEALHARRSGWDVPTDLIDPFSSAAADAPVRPPRTWLLRIGWRRGRGGGRWHARVPL